MRRFITDLAPSLRAISSAIVVDARRVGGSMYRIHRDTRFCASDFLDRYIESCRVVAPLVAFLTRALGWKW
jgi:uncharacterized protein (DUF2461 family)